MFAALDQRGRRWPAVVGTGLLCIALASAWCGAWWGAMNRPYLFLYILSSGVAGLVAPWLVQALATRVVRAPARTESARLP